MIIRVERLHHMGGLPYDHVIRRQTFRINDENGQDH